MRSPPRLWQNIDPQQQGRKRPEKKDESWDCIQSEDSLTASGFRSAVLSEMQGLTILTQTQMCFFSSMRQKSDTVLFLCIKCLLSETSPPPQSGHVNQQCPPFQPSGSPRSPRLLKKRKALVTALGFLSCLPQNVSWHKALILVSAHSHSTANKCDLLFLPPTATRKKREEKTHLHLAN